MKRGKIGMAVLTAMLTVACTPKNLRSDGDLEREALVGLDRPVPSALPIPGQDADISAAEAAATANAKGDIRRGSGRFIAPHAAEHPRQDAKGAGSVTLNFENQPIEAVVKAILGDLLDVNYSIAPGVEGSISFSTAKPVRREEALPILETLLSWTGNALVREQGRYSVLPTTRAVPGRIAPTLKAAKPASGLQARLYPLRHVAAPAMAKLLEPFVVPGSILLADPARNVLVVAGTRDELSNYQETIDTFDVDWISGMSVGVFSLEHASVDELLPALESVFGEKSGTPIGGLFRFIPIARTNALVVIATRPDHIDQVGDWVARIDRGGGNEPRLFVYEVRNLLASDVAKYVGNVFGGAVSGDTSPRVAPGLAPATLDGEQGFGTGSADTLGSDAQADAGESSSFFQGPAPAASSGKGGDARSGVSITAVDSNNQLIVRARPSQWAEIRQAIERLDAVPLQVQIETRILEVSLRDEFRFGVQWYLEGLAGGNGGVGQPGNKQQWALGAAPAIGGKPDTFFYSFVNSELQVAIRAMERDTNTKILSAPSLVVVNNRKARIQVGDQIPVTQTYVNTGQGNNNQVGQVEYKDTGVILDVRPRVNPGGLVYLDVAQEVSRPDPAPAGQNRPIVKRKLTTQVAVQSGQTVLLGGLIRDLRTKEENGVPGLSRIPFLGALFRDRSNARVRTELLVLITPRVITNGEDAKRVSDDYRRAFRSLRPFENSPGTASEPASAVEG
ncbi:type II secretion system secretin GspD [Luteibacter sp. SG786]|uniref:type II secretion system secretin GspD n=1 Tax=Luteibacter sp. SG786 TaxID=2587130 RepID=UPI00141EF37A|nr:type II secretion system secretin GspD [Luteibacter sp. SG786]NII56058.1 general secretion pathway protein D [Luteibacter sp. SG786]